MVPLVSPVAMLLPGAIGEDTHPSQTTTLGGKVHRKDQEEDSRWVESHCGAVEEGRQADRVKELPDVKESLCHIKSLRNVTFLREGSEHRNP